MKYPYIGKDIFFGQVYLILSGSDAITMDGAALARTPMEDDRYKNITHDYLQNTYGEVQSPEHAEFIIELASNHGYKCEAFEIANNGYFYINGNRLYFTEYMDAANYNNEKEITIPLPPKADKQELSGMPPENLNFRCVMVDIEWPQIDSEVAWGSGHAGVVKSLSDGFAWVKRSDNSQYVTLYISSLKKPKTPEEEFASELIEKYKHLPNHEQAFAIARDVIDNAIAKTKKA